MKYNNLGMKNVWGINLAFMFVVSVLILLAVFGAIKTNAQTFSPLTTYMSLGSRGADVSSLQLFLASNPGIYPEGLVTGYYGTLTTAAVARFQQANELPAVGVVGPLTLAKINQLMALGGGIDMSGAVISNISVKLSDEKAVISWDTNEVARAKIFYSTDSIVMVESGMSRTEPYISGTVLNDSSFGMQKSITLDNLSSGLYSYVIEAIDLSGNVSVSGPWLFNLK